MEKDYNYWIEKLDLKTHPEGGYYTEIYESNEMIPGSCLPKRYDGNRAFATSIYFLITSKIFSAFHRLQSDEIWNFYCGSPIILHIISPGGRYFKVHLGSNPEYDEVFQYVVLRGYWIAASVLNENSYSLAGATVVPGFTFYDFEMAKKEILVKQFPHLEDVVHTYCK